MSLSHAVRFSRAVFSVQPLQNTKTSSYSLINSKAWTTTPLLSNQCSIERFSQPSRNWHTKPKRESKDAKNSFDEDDDDNEKFLPLHHKNLQDQLSESMTVKVGRHTKITSGGRVYSFSALVIAGTGKGSGGFGYGKAASVTQAMDNATKDLQKNLFSVYRFENRTIPIEINVKYGATKLLMKPLPKDAGLKGHPHLVFLAQAFGFKDMLMKIYGSRNPHHIIRAMIKGLVENVEAPEERARRLGKKYVNFSKMWKPGQPSPFAFSMPHQKEIDYSMYEQLHRKDNNDEDLEDLEEGKRV